MTPDLESKWVKGKMGLWQASSPICPPTEEVSDIWRGEQPGPKLHSASGAGPGQEPGVLSSTVLLPQHGAILPKASSPEP